MKFNVVIVDDELPAIGELEDALHCTELVADIRKFTRPSEAFSTIVDIRPDIVFLDIEMPGMSGLALAGELIRVAPECEVIFVTAYEQYALEAFGLSAVDYLLKPVDSERLKETLHRIQRRRQRDWRQVLQKMEIRCFGPLSVEGAYGKVKWRTNKVSEIFAYLHLHNEVSPERIIDDLFTETEEHKAKSYLHTCVYQLRKNLNTADLSDHIQIHFNQNMYLMETNQISSDIQRFNWVAAQIDPNRELLQEAVSLYNGELLEGFVGLWVLEYRENSRRHYIRMGKQLVDGYIADGDLHKALEVAQMIHKHDPLDELLVIEVVRLYRRLNQNRQAEDYFNRFLMRYQDELGKDSLAAIEQYRIMVGQMNDD